MCYSNWKRWDAVGDNNHAVMVYEGGERCWNGPDRSMKVRSEAAVCMMVSTVVQGHSGVRAGECAG